MTALIAIPAYNEASTIASVVHGCRQLSDVDVMVFLDSPTDGTSAIVQSLGVAHHSEPFNVGLARNFFLIIEHFLASSCDYLVVVDGDGQYAPDQVDRVLAEARSTQADLVIGSRFLREESANAVPAVRKVVNRRLASVVSWVMGLKRSGPRGAAALSDVTSGLRAYSRRAALSIPPLGGHSYTLPSLAAICQLRLRILEVPVHATYSSDRESAISGSYVKFGRYLLSSLSRTILIAGYQRLLPIFVIGQAVSILLGLTFLGLSWNAGSFRGWLFLVGIAGFVSLTCTILFAAYFAVVQGLRAETRVFALQQTVARTMNSSQPCSNCTGADA